MKLYPVMVSVNVQITDGKGTDGTATYMCPLNTLPTEETMPGIIEAVFNQLPPDFRLMTRHESMMHFLRNEKGYRGPTMAPPKLDAGTEWHDPETENVMSFDGGEEECEE